MKKDNRGGKRDGAGAPSTGRVQKPYWTDLKTHATISKIVEARKLKQLTDEALEKLTNEIIGK